MKRFLIQLLLVSGLCLSLSVPAQSFRWANLTTEQAINIVRSFEYNQQLEVKFQELVVDEITDPEGFDTSCEYKLVAGRYSYTVSRFSPTLISRIDTLYEANEHNPPPVQISKTQALQIAKEFVQSHYPHPSLLNYWTITESYTNAFFQKPDGSLTKSYLEAYYVRFRQYCGNGLWGPAIGGIKIDASQGNIILYFQTYYPIFVSWSSIISKEEAIAFAINQLSMGPGASGKIVKLYISRPDVMGKQMVLYYLLCTDDHGSLYATIDAHTGRLMGWDSILGGGSSKKSSSSVSHLPKVSKLLKTESLKFCMEKKPVTLHIPPLLLNNQPYYYLGYLGYGATGSKVVYNAKAKTVSLSGEKRQLNFALNSLSYQLNGKPAKLSSKMMLVNGRCYVPLDVVREVLGVKASYNAKTKTVEIDTPKSKTASQ